MVAKNITSFLVIHTLQTEKTSHNTVHGLGTIAGVEQVHSSTLHGMCSSVDGLQCNLEGSAGPDKVQIVELQGFCEQVVYIAL